MQVKDRRDQPPSTLAIARDQCAGVRLVGAPEHVSGLNGFDPDNDHLWIRRQSRCVRGDLAAGQVVQPDLGDVGAISQCFDPADGRHLGARLVPLQPACVDRDDNRSAVGQMSINERRDPR